MRAGVCVVFGKSRRSSGVEESITQQRAARKSVEAVHIARDKGTKQSITRLSLCTAVATVGRWRAQDIETLCSAIFFLVVHKFDGVLVVEDSAEEVVRHIGTPVRRCRRRATHPRVRGCASRAPRRAPSTNDDLYANTRALPLARPSSCFFARGSGCHVTTVVVQKNVHSFKSLAHTPCATALLANVCTAHVGAIVKIAQVFSGGCQGPCAGP